MRERGPTIRKLSGNRCCISRIGMQSTCKRNHLNQSLAALKLNHTWLVHGSYYRDRLAMIIRNEDRNLWTLDVSTKLCRKFQFNLVYSQTGSTHPSHPGNVDRPINPN